MADVTWAPEVAEAVAARLRLCNVLMSRQQEGDVARAALSASPLPEAVALIETLCTILIRGDYYRREQAAADAAAFVARVRR